MSLDAKTEELFRRIRRKCQERGWFGGDEWMDPGFSPRPPFRTDFPLPATEEQLQHVEHQLGFPFPPLLRLLYLHLANGAVGFGFGILPAETVLREYRAHRERRCFNGAWHWPEQLLPLCDWGDYLRSYVDIDLGAVLFADAEALFHEQGMFLLEAPSLSTWFERWVTKQDRFPPLTQQAAGDEVDRDEPEDEAEEEDQQAKAMGLESLEDDRHTPVPFYVGEYRRLRGQ